MSISPGQGLPREPEDRVLLKDGDQIRTVSSFADLRGCVDIHSEERALEYLRFFSSYDTVHMFAKKELEVHNAKGEKCFAVCLPEDRWKARNLQEPVVARAEDGFDVTRYVIRPTLREPEVELFRITQRVERDGNVTEVRSDLIPIGGEDSLRLFFPSFM